MSINFIPNDPKADASAPAMRSQAKRPNRPTSKATFSFAKAPAEGEFDPGTPQFLFWQSREAALAAVAAWEDAVAPLSRWQGNRKKVPLLADAGEDLNAGYDCDSFSFYHQEVKGTTYFSGESTDVVAHEVGHGLLDSVRPDFWDVNYLEVGAFHEAFGDCTALLTTLNDSENSRTRIESSASALLRVDQGHSEIEQPCVIVSSDLLEWVWATCGNTSQTVYQAKGV